MTLNFAIAGFSALRNLLRALEEHADSACLEGYPLTV
jgi:hypothetical protein